ncbi:MAG: NAD(+)/NADH kinase [Eubacterium sp.]|nr:NAD(+)/NADH kinase [Eubacterium sp.]
MKNYLIITNKQKDTRLALSKHVKTMFESKGANCTIDYAYRKNDTQPISVPEGTECILVIGGDGTILNAASRLIGTNIPLLGINRGTLGFLADIDVYELDMTIDDLMADKYQLEKRIMLHADVYRDGEILGSYKVLNDIVISHAEVGKVVGLSVMINDSLSDSYRGDGVIICTPTGATGYNLSAGGPIINPTCRNYLVTPICPHSLTTRSVVLAEEDIVTVRVDDLRGTKKAQAVLSFDGKEGMFIRSKDQVKIRIAEEETPFIKTKEVSFAKILKEKML